MGYIFCHFAWFSPAYNHLLFAFLLLVTQASLDKINCVSANIRVIAAVAMVVERTFQIFALLPLCFQALFMHLYDKHCQKYIDTKFSQNHQRQSQNSKQR